MNNTIDDASSKEQNPVDVADINYPEYEELFNEICPEGCDLSEGVEDTSYMYCEDTDDNATSVGGFTEYAYPDSCEDATAKQVRFGYLFSRFIVIGVF